MVPPVDIYETENEYVIKADMPAVQKENIDITLNNDKLELRGKVTVDTERDDVRYGEYELYDYYRSFNVGNDISSAAISAHMKDGVLTLTLPKREEIKPKKIEIKVN
ncbi:MAG: heat-shock protein SP21 [Spirochaetae bacterium HGW-Spirochaetae-1]|nr:MAG: heat-shock protein SP21 [Spirochaetae bacterium HGW-Spirochaetae-1]